MVEEGPLYEEGDFHYWTFPTGTFDSDFEPTGTPFSSYEEARNAVDAATEPMDIWRTPAAGGKAEFVERVDPVGG
jgi:hypothetical protein